MSLLLLVAYAKFLLHSFRFKAYTYHFKYLQRLATCFTLVSCFPYSSTLNMEATCYYETSVDFQETAQLYHNHGCENLKSYNSQEH
jgi:hypothetical protein